MQGTLLLAIFSFLLLFFGEAADFKSGATPSYAAVPFRHTMCVGRCCKVLLASAVVDGPS